MLKTTEVVVVRHPDSGTEVLVFEDGREVTHERGVFVTVIDPGLGHELHDWRKARRLALATASPAAAQSITGGFVRYDASEFITTDESCSFVERDGSLCGNSLLDGEGYDGYCGPHADMAEELA